MPTSSPSSGKFSSPLFTRPAAPGTLTPLEEQVVLQLYAQGRLPEAERAARAITERLPQHPFGWKALGAIIKAQKRALEALPIQQQAAKLSPQDPEAFNNLGGTLEELGHTAHAETCYRHALDAKADFLPALDNLFELLNRQKRWDDLTPIAERRLQHRPDDGHLQHLVAMLTGKQTDSAPKAYVEGLFNDYANEFDHHLQHTLKYHVPQDLAALVQQHASQAGGWRVLDLGCGTGLVGEALAPQSSELIGVDLADKMLEKARSRQIYQELVQDEVVHYMTQAANERFDVITSADVFIYVGRLDEVMAEARRLLPAGGLLAFSIETCAPENDTEGRGYRLLSSGRYAHTLDYVQRLGQAHGFTPLAAVDTVLRTENEQPLAGQLVVWQR